METKSELFERLIKESGYTFRDVGAVPHHEIDHSHCWDQGREPACGISLEEHACCCLCGKARTGYICKKI